MFRRREKRESLDLTLDTPDTPYSKSYAIVVSSMTMNDADWGRVVTALLELHPDAAVLVFSDNDFRQVLDSLRQQMPRYVAFVCQPTECGRIFVGECHQLMRSLDKDPYIDAMWGIITGRDADSAIRSIDNESIEQPFIVQRAITFTKVNPDVFDSYFMFSDDKKGLWSSKNSPLDVGCGQQDQGEQYPKEPAAIFYDKLYEMEPDLIVTSGHGYEDSVEMPWSMGKLAVCDEGLAPMGEQSEQVAPIIEESSNPKIYLPIANCLVGHCNGPVCMVTTFMGRLGVRQMCGYTVFTWFGRAGWGTLRLWTSVPGRLSLSDTFFLHQARMTYSLKAINPRLLKFKYDLSGDPGFETVVEQIDKQFQFDKDKIDSEVLEEIYGLSYDRDTFVLYGDPAFVANFDKEKNEQILSTKFLRTGGNSHRFVVEFKDAETAQQFSEPIGSFFTSRIQDFNIINGFEYEPILSDNFLILLKAKPQDPQSTTIEVDFRGTIIS